MLVNRAPLSALGNALVGGGHTIPLDVSVGDLDANLSCCEQMPQSRDVLWRDEQTRGLHINLKRQRIHPEYVYSRFKPKSEKDDESPYQGGISSFTKRKQ